MASCILPMLNPMNHGVLWSTGQIWCPMGGLTDPGADIPESWDWRLRVAQWCGRRQHVTIEIRWGEEIGFKNLIVNQWLASPWRNSWRRWWRERESSIKSGYKSFNMFERSSWKHVKICENLWNQWINFPDEFGCPWQLVALLKAWATNVWGLLRGIRHCIAKYDIYHISYHILNTYQMSSGRT
jgi:hypothetical protein